ncbi:hypothetical protein A2U01_0014124 [Trifolium medium]|uniref:Uncharacterized protein n=1 Tax=Trifolium medium TaxID=97028 RepID=A0A392N052_9FABA|nr:hypothetical protein [Trifolium medium]
MAISISPSSSLIPPASWNSSTRLGASSSSSSSQLQFPVRTPLLRIATPRLPSSSSRPRFLPPVIPILEMWTIGLYKEFI